MVKTAEQQLIARRRARAAERSLELANTLYQEGYADFQRVLDAQRALFAQAERNCSITARTSAPSIDAVQVGRRRLGRTCRWNKCFRNPCATTMQDRTNWGDLLDEPVPTDAAP